MWTVEFAEQASGCRVCAKRIQVGKLRVVEEDTYQARGGEGTRTKYTNRHVDCALESNRERALHAFTSADESVQQALVAALSKLQPTLARELAAGFEARARPVTSEVGRLDDPRTQDLLSRLEENLEDRAVAELLSDHLQDLGDPRGELMALDLAASVDSKLAERRRQLREAHLPREGPAGLSAWDRGLVQWHLGFLHTLELRVEGDLQDVALLRHPSARLLHTLKLHRLQDALLIRPGTLPRSLRSLTLRGHVAPESSIAGLPHLQSLTVDQTTHLAHPTLTSLSISRVEEALPEDLAARFPNVLSLNLHGEIGPISGLGRFLSTLESLSLTAVPLGEEDVRFLEQQLSSRPLRALELTFCTLDHSYLSRLKRLATSLQFTGAPWRDPLVRHVKHTNKPEWGVGKVVRNVDGKLEIAFRDATRVFKDGSPFLQDVDGEG